MQSFGFKKQAISGIVLFLLIFNLVGIGLAYPKKTFAFGSEVVHVATSIPQAIGNAFQRLWQAWEKAYNVAKDQQKHWAAVAFKAALHNFLRQLAIETATYIATGDEGQKPMFFTKNWERYLRDAADQAAGTFIMTVAQGWDNAMRVNNENAWNRFEDELNDCLEQCEEEENNNDEPVDLLSSCYDRCEKEYNSKIAGTDKITVGTAGTAFSSGPIGNITRFLCQPSDVRVKLKIMGGLDYIRNPVPPRCTISKAIKNWESFTKDKNFLRDFQDYWEPYGNDVGIALSIYSSFLHSQEEIRAIKTVERQTNRGWKDVTDNSGWIKTPADLVRALGSQPIEQGTSYEKVSTGDIIADAFATFTQTLMGKLLEKWGRKGIVRGHGEEGWFDWSAYFAGKTPAEIALENKGGPRRAAQERFAKSFRPQFDAGKAFSVLSKLMSCPDPQNPGPTDCVIDDKFAQAVQQELTVQKAIEEGYLDLNKTFGFRSDGLEPAYNEGYPYRSLIILRKYRILPISWELAALWIRDQVLNSTNPKTFNLADVLYRKNGYDGPIVDGQWVLKAPEEYCNLKGYGEHIIDAQTTEGIDNNNDGLFNGEGERPPRLIVQRDKYCADERSCIKEGPGGNCLFYGYCTEEKRIWDFQGDECPDYENSCQSFTSRTGRAVSYLKKTLDFGNCGEESVGCREYCRVGDPAGQGWACQGSERVLTDYCSNPEGCEVVDTNDIDQDNDTTESCLVPYLGVDCYLSDSHARLVYNFNYTLDSQSNIYLNSKTEQCSEKDEGCHEFIRARTGLGTNLLVNADLEQTEPDGNIFQPIAWQRANGEATTTAYFSGSASYVIISNGGSLEQTIDTGYSLEERKFIFSLYAYNCADGQFGFKNNNGSESFEDSLESTDTWQRFEVKGVFSISEDNTNPHIVAYLVNLPSGCYIDALQLEEVQGSQNQASPFHDYGQTNVVYLKKAPSYYQCDQYSEIQQETKEECVSNGHLWRDDINACVTGGSPECARFIFPCSRDDIGCDLYSPENGDPAIPAVTRANDSCPSECVGYNVYRQEATFFESPKFPEFLIPNNEKKCSFLDAGCSEFTNLDKLAEGGESKEYYTYLRPCHEVDATCQPFYTWVGSEETGYQLKAFSLRDANDDGVPDSVFDKNNNGVVDGGERNPEDYFGPCQNIDDALTNPECYEFYSATGEISYHHYRDTFLCSQECHPYRKTKSNQTDCENSWGEWKEIDIDGDGNIDKAYCLYKGYEPESWQCPASANNCYEYKGNSSNNLKVVIDDSFEGSQNNWGAGEFSSESLVAGGHSLKVESGNELNYPLKLQCSLGGNCDQAEGCECQVDRETVCYVAQGENSCLYRDLVQPGRTYLVSFWAKGTGNLTVQFSSAPDNDHKFASGDIALGPDWLNYSLGPVYVDWEIPVGDTLKIAGFSDTSYIDNIVLKEVRDYYFLIRPPRQWNIPVSCDQDSAGNLAPQFALGCEEYTSQISGETVYLKSFYHLCSPATVGCEAMIDTMNTISPFAQTFNSGDISEVDIGADQMVSFVYDPKKTCPGSSKGCEALGLPQYRYNMHGTTGPLETDRVDDTYDLYSYKTFYLVNNPEKYDDILCRAIDDGCDAFTTESGENFYFKDPLAHSYDRKGAVCEWTTTEGHDEGWYITGTEEGEANCPLYYELGVGYPSGVCLSGKKGASCQSDSDCLGGKCLVLPGVCSSSYDTCNQYIDPLGKISQSLVFNGDFSQDADKNGTPDGWEQEGGYYKSTQPINFHINTLYSITVSLQDGISGNYAVYLYGCQDINRNPAQFFPIEGDDAVNIVEENSSTIVEIIADGVSSGFSGRFYNGDAPVTCQSLKVTANLKDTGQVGIHPNQIYYYLDNSLDKEGCNGRVDYESGCVLFNRRNIGSNGSLEDLIYDADYSLVEPVSGLQNDSNLLLKVKPDRTCNKWLACKNIAEYENEAGEKRQYCTSIGLCDEVDEQGECAHFVFSEQENQNYGENLSDEDIKNKSGFVKIGIKKAVVGIKQGYINSGYFPFDVMEERGNITTVPNGDFERYNPDGYPIGWYITQQEWKPYLFKVINNPLDAQKEGVNYPVSGKSFLKFSPSLSPIESQFIDVEPGGEYILSAYLNTLNFHQTPDVSSTGAGIVILTYNSKGQRINKDGDVVSNGEVDIEECKTDPAADNDYPPDPQYNNCGFYLPPGKDWTRLVQRFKVGSHTHRIKLMLVGKIWWGQEGSCDVVCNPSIDCFTTETSIDNPCLSSPFNCSGDSRNTLFVPDNPCGGNVYIDNIQIAPALYVHKDEDKQIDYENFMNSAYLMPQTCRVYPRSDSLACSYFDEKGILNVGRLGYCLEYDHYPGNPQQCLIWYPVDLVLGESIKDEGGYNGRYPLYYSLDKKEGESVSIDNKADICVEDLMPGSEKIVKLDGPAYVADPSQAFIKVQENTEKDLVTYGLSLRDVFTKQWSPRLDIEHTSTAGDHVDHWYIWDLGGSGDSEAASFHSVKYFDAIKLTCVDGDGKDGDCDCVNYEIGSGIKYLPYATRIVQVVTPYMDNKAWSSRISEGSSYKTIDTVDYNGNSISGYSYGADYLPFGAVVFPEPNYDPTLWDTTEKEGLQPLYFMDPSLSFPPPYQPRGGQLHTLDSTKRLFAQSYGVWQWTDSYCVGGEDNGKACSDICQVKGLGECVYNNEDGVYNCQTPLPYFSLREDLFAYEPPYDSDQGGQCQHVPSSNPNPVCLPYTLHSISYIGKGSDFQDILGIGPQESVALMTYYDKWWAWVFANNNLSPDRWTVLGADLFCEANAGGFCNALNGEEGSLVIDAMTFVNKGVLRNLGNSDGLTADRLFLAIGDRYWLYTKNSWTNEEGYFIAGIVPGLTKIDAITLLKSGHFLNLGDTGYNRLFIISGDDYYIVADTLSGWSLNASGNVSSLWGVNPSCGSNCPKNIESLLGVASYDFSPEEDVIMINSGGKYWVWHSADNTFVSNYIACSLPCPGGSCVSAGDSRKHYYPVEGYDWIPPDKKCKDNSRPSYDGSGNDYCGIPPQVRNIKVNGINQGYIYIYNNQSINLTFNTQADPEQLPLISYTIDWGDGIFSATGLKILDKPNPSSPHSFYHLYNYWDMKNKEDRKKIKCAEKGGEINGLENHKQATCLSDAPCCATVIKIKIKDNWGWCNGTGDRAPGCQDAGDYYQGVIIVSQKRKSEEVVFNYPRNWSTIIASYISRDAFGNLSLVFFDNGAEHGVPYYYSYDLKGGGWSSGPASSLGNGDHNAPSVWNSILAAGAYRDANQDNDFYYFLDSTYYYVYTPQTNEWSKGNLSDFSGANSPSWPQVKASGMYKCGEGFIWYVLDSSTLYIYDGSSWSQSPLSGFSGVNAPSDWSKVTASGILADMNDCNLYSWYVIDSNGNYYVWQGDNSAGTGSWTTKGSLDDFTK